MLAPIDASLPVHQRRRGRQCAYWNGAIWAIGNGMTSTTLVTYLAQDLGAQRIGLGISLIVAARYIVGLLRLGAPAMIGRLVDRKHFCLGNYLLSAVVLFGLPLASAPGWLPSAEASLAALVVLWCVYHLLEYFAAVALWSWLADLVPLRVRGRFLGRRERWMVAGNAAAMLDTGLFVWGWHALYPEQPGWIAYAIPAVVGACFMVAAVVPLGLMPPAQQSAIVRRGASLRSMLAPFADARFLPLLAFGCWLSFFDGVTQSGQFIYPKGVLGISLFTMLALRTGTRCGQWAVSPSLGRLADRWGNRPVMTASLLVAATGPLFFLAATRQQWWWFGGAWLVWIAWAGVNVCQPNLMLKLAPRDANTPYIAAYYAVTGLCFAASTIAGGAALDRLGGETFFLFGGALALGFFPYVFLLGWVTRTVSVLLLGLVVEDGGRRALGKYRKGK